MLLLVVNSGCRIDAEPRGVEDIKLEFKMVHPAWMIQPYNRWSYPVLQRGQDCRSDRRSRGETLGSLAAPLSTSAYAMHDTS